MADYADTSRYIEEFARSYASAYAVADNGYIPYDDGGYSNAPIEEALAAHEGAPAPAPEWRDIIASLAPAQPLSLGAKYLREAQDPKHPWEPARGLF